MKKTLIVLACAISAFAQIQNQIGMVSRGFYNGSLLQYVCEAPVSVTSTNVSVSAGSLTSIGVSSNVGTVTTVASHYLWPGAWITVSGSSTAALNGTYTVLTTPSPTTFTVTTSGVSDATYTTGLVISTSSPLYNSSVWRVTALRYDGANNWEGTSLGGGTLSLGYRAKCSDRATY